MSLKTKIIEIILKRVLGGTLDKIKTFLSGKKTYLVAVGMIITALVEYAGTGDLGTLINKVIEAFAFMTVRSAIAKTTV